ncbi:MAG: exodeoxyribonuclease VII small subunit [Planctomycetota bacterium]
MNSISAGYSIGERHFVGDQLMAKKKRAAAAEKQADKSVDFESSLADVEQIVQQLESGELGLSESLVEYERGIAKIQQCHQVLENAERRIAVLTRVDEDGTAHVEPVGEDVDSPNSPAGPSPRTRTRSKKRSSPPISDSNGPEGLF